MEFSNENTFSMGEHKINELFEKALGRVRKDLCKRNPLYIAGEKVFSDEEVETVSPIDRRIVLGYFQKAKAEHACEAVEAAREAFYSAWRDIEWKGRVKIFKKASSVLRKRKFEVAAILSLENGKTRNESIGEVDEAIDFLTLYSSMIEKNNDLIIERGPYISQTETATFGYHGARSSGERIKIISKPYGVWSVIAPFNFPISISTGMCSAALITGNTVVFKPSFGDNPTPLTGLEIYNVFVEAGLPKGVFNYITGSGSEVGNELVTNPHVSGIAFTGSHEVGMNILRKAVSFNIPKQVVAEMGSKNPVVVSDSADVNMAVRGVVSAAFGFAGQKCSACSRAFIHSRVCSRFLERLVKEVKALRIGNPLEKQVYSGPLIGKTALERYLFSVEKAKKEGRIVYGGHRLVGNDLFDNGYYVEPAIIEVSPQSDLFRKELFLPILAVTMYDDFDEAMRMANDTEYGLTAGLYTSREREKAHFNDNIEFGTTYINRGVSATTGAVVGQQTFAGRKGSSVTCKGTSSLSYLMQFVGEHSQTVVE